MDFRTVSLFVTALSGGVVGGVVAYSLFGIRGILLGGLVGGSAGLIVGKYRIYDSG